MEYNAAAVEALRKRVAELEKENQLLLQSTVRLQKKIEKIKPTVISSSNINI